MRCRIIASRFTPKHSPPLKRHKVKTSRRWSKFWENYKLYVIGEDAHYAVINKPRGMLSVPIRDWGSEPDCLQWHLDDLYPSMAKDFHHSDTLGVVHRLDRGTSGCNLIAKTVHGFNYLKKVFELERELLRKIYHTVVHGIPEPLEGRIDYPLFYSGSGEISYLPWEAESKGLGRAEQHDALTEYRVLASFDVDGQQYSHVEVHILTGRMHQIRAHFMGLGFPLVLEPRYSDVAVSDHPEFLRDAYHPGPILHAYRLDFPHPKNKKRISLWARPPLAFKRVLDALEPHKITDTETA